MMTPSHDAGHRQPTKAFARLFPIPVTESDTDRRFTFGLVLDVLAVLAEHGYPDAKLSSFDFIEMQQALFNFLYRPSSTPGGELR